MIRVTDTILIDESELDLKFVRSSGSGGQNVNKVSTAVQLRYDPGKSAYLTDEIRDRLTGLAGSKATSDGVIVIEARRHRTQERNRREAVERLIALVRTAAVPPKRRRATKPSAASRTRRLEAKRKTSIKKQRRRYRPEMD